MILLFVCIKAAYGSYGSSYTHPQIPTTVPQTAAYGAYPPTYPVQVNQICFEYIRSAFANLLYELARPL